MSLQKTASKAALLLQCPRPFSEGVDLEYDEPGEAAIYGTRWHKEISTRLWGVSPCDNNELGRHVSAALKELRAWMLPDGNPFGLHFHITEVEASRALDLTKSSGAGRPVTLNDADGAHLYEDIDDAKEMGGTADLILEAESPVGIFRVVLDHKTGEHEEYYIHPSELEQMQVLAEMWDADAVAILHTPRNVPPIIYAEEVDRASRFRHDLWKANRLVDSGFLRVGRECKFCPARLSCPAKQGELIAATSQILGAALVKKTEPMTPGKFHQLRTQWNALEKQAMAQLREAVRTGEIIERPDGKVLSFGTKLVERLSKKSIIEAYGKARGEEVLQQLRDDGALSEVEQEELRAK
jgi:hypothetical protein